MKKIILLIFCSLLVHLLNAQITTGELPLGFDPNISRSLHSVPLKSLLAPDMGRIEAEDLITDDQPGPVRFACAINVNYTLNNSGQWQTLDDGSKLWRLKVHMPGALSTNAFYDAFWLPKGAKFFVYSEGTKQSIGAITSEYLNSDQENPFAFSTGLIYGDEVTFEYYQPENVHDSAIISISRIDYGYRFVDNPYVMKTSGFEGSDDCLVNINCEEGQDWQNEKHAIARIVIPLNNGSGWCSCALVNNTANDNTPYILTADHCLQDGHGNYLFDAINNNDASQWIFYWAYEHTGCDNNTLEPPHRTTTGAIIVANNSVSDFALLRLTQDPRNVNGFAPYYLGWSRLESGGVGGVGIHHPRGDVKKISTYNVTPLSTNYDSNNFSSSGNHWRIQWIRTQTNHSITEPGSSGSPLINDSRYIIGQLHGGTASCSYLNDPDWYGKFSVSWTGNGASDRRRRLRDWLDPVSKNPIVLNARNPYSISGPSFVCDQATYTIDNLPPGTTVQWSASTSLQLVSGQGTESAVFMINGNGLTTVEAQLSIISPSLSLSNIWVGVPDPPEMVDCNLSTPPGFPQRDCFSLCFHSYASDENTRFFHSDHRSNILQWQWEKVSDNFHWGVNENEINFWPNNSNSSVTFRGRVRNACGWSEWNEYSLGVITCDNPIYISLYPNPATDMVTVELKEEMLGDNRVSVQRSVVPAIVRPYEIQLWSASAMLGRYTTNQPVYQIPVGGLPAGIYFVRVIKDGEVLTKKLIKR